MNKLFIGLMLLTSSLTFAADSFSGTALLGKQEQKVTVETNMFTAKNVTIQDTKYSIDTINSTEINSSLKVIDDETGAENVTQVLVYYGSVMKQIVVMDKSQLASYFNLENAEELNCAKNSKGFIVITGEKSILGNCINKIPAKKK